jgi:hypothetical protein
MQTALKILIIWALILLVVGSLFLVNFIVDAVWEATLPRRLERMNITPRQWESILGFHERVKEDYFNGKIEEHQWYEEK